MTRDTLLDFFEDFSRLDDPFVIHDDGYKARTATYREVADASRAFASRLSADGIGAGDKVVIWSENRAEWIVALWGCLLAGVVVVPVDFRASAELVRRITSIVEAKAIFVGHEVDRPNGTSAAVWPLAEVPMTGSAGPGTTAPHPARPGPSTLAEIIFTSGATADPKGVTLTHRNILANIIPIEREIRKYRRYERPFHPIRFLNLLPLSHMFGQSMATFVPPMLGGTVVFSHGFSPVEIVRQIKTRRISVLVVVPKVLDVLREHIERAFPETARPDPLEGKHWAWRWWHYRQVHRAFGWKFWCIVCGAAALDPEVEAFWRKLGFLVVQGYGLTETAPVVTLNHPFRASKGSVGTPIAGVDVKIADDGEILVRGENVTAGYYRGGSAGGVDESEAFQDGWFHTGDIGELDSAGRLTIKGRKKEMIVTAQGLNVFPEDVERALLGQAGVIDAGVVGLPIDGEERIHAILVLEPDANLESILRRANAVLEDHQRVWSTSIWPGDALPRTEGTQKLKRRDLRRWAESGLTSTPPDVAGGHSVEDVVGRFASGRPIADDTTLDELGLSSLDRVELLMALEDAFQTTLDERALAEAPTIKHLKELLTSRKYEGGSRKYEGAGAPGSLAEPIHFPAWNRSWWSRTVRRASLPTWILPLARVFVDLRVDGLEHLASISGPVIFAANHQSHMDTPVILLALPPKWRYRVAPAMAKEFFVAHFNPETVTRKAWFTNSLNYYLACQFFNAFPLPQRETGTRQTLRYVGEVTGDGYSVLIFPEGRREQETVGSFRPGVAMMSARLDVPVVPVRLEGLDRVLHPKARWPTRGPVRVAFGAPMRLTGDDYPALARQVEDAVRAL